MISSKERFKKTPNEYHSIVVSSKFDFGLRTVSITQISQLWGANVNVLSKSVVSSGRLITNMEENLLRNSMSLLS